MIIWRRQEERSSKENSPPPLSLSLSLSLIPCRFILAPRDASREDRSFRKITSAIYSDAECPPRGTESLRRAAASITARICISGVRCCARELINQTDSRQ